MSTKCVTTLISRNLIRLGGRLRPLARIAGNSNTDPYRLSQDFKRRAALAHFAEAQGVFRAARDNQHPDIPRPDRLDTRRPDDGCPGHEYGDGGNAVPGRRRRNGVRRRSPRVPGDPGRILAVSFAPPRPPNFRGIWARRYLGRVNNCQSLDPIIPGSGE